MDQRELRERLRDAAFTLATPFTDGGDAVDERALADNVSGLEAAGASLFVPCGNTGEYYALTDDERVEVVRTTVEAASADATVVAGAGGSTPEMLDFADRYADAGADAVMVMTPPHTYLHEAGLVEYYRRLADGADVPLVLYKRDPVVTDDVLLDVVDHGNVAGVKYAVDDVEAFSSTVARAEGDVVWLNGIAERYVPSFALEGAEGFTTGVGNFLPRAVLALRDAVDAGDWERARSLRDRFRPLEALRDGTGPDNDLAAANNVPVVKHGMDLAGYEGGPVREPLVGLSDPDQERVRELYESLARAAGRERR